MNFETQKFTSAEKYSFKFGETKRLQDYAGQTVPVRKAGVMTDSNGKDVLCIVTTSDEYIVSASGSAIRDYKDLFECFGIDLQDITPYWEQGTTSNYLRMDAGQVTKSLM